MIHAWCQAGELPKAEALPSFSPVCGCEAWLERLPGLGVQPTVTSYGAIINCVAKAGETRQAEAWIDRALAWLAWAFGGRGMQAAGVRADVASYNMVLGAYCRSGAMQEAEQLLETIFARGLRPNGSSMNLVLSPLARSLDRLPTRGGYLQQRRVREACESLNRLRRRGLRLEPATWKLLSKSGVSPELLEALAHPNRAVDRR